MVLLSKMLNKTLEKLPEHEGLDLFKKAIRDATSLCNKYQDEEQFNKDLFKEPEYELLNFINSKISKYKDKDPEKYEAAKERLGETLELLFSELPRNTAEYLLN